jgi:hypothetical protein
LELQLKRYKFVLNLICIIVFSAGITSAYEVQTAGCLIRGADNDSAIVNYLAEQVRANQSRFKHYFAVELRDPPVRIDIPDDEDGFNNITHKMLPEWSAGVAFSGQRRIIINPGNYYDPVRYREILLHEMAHIYISELCDPTRIPLWYNEGIAMFMSDKSVTWQDGILIGNAVSTNRIIDIQQIDSLLHFGESKARLAYLQSFLAVKYLIAEHGSEIVSQLLRAVSGGQDFNSALLTHTGNDLIDFEFDYYRQLKKEYRWMALLQFNNLFWVLIIFLIILSFIAVKLRNRRKLKDWNLTEE